VRLTSRPPVGAVMDGWRAPPAARLRPHPEPPASQSTVASTSGVASTRWSITGRLPSRALPLSSMLISITHLSRVSLMPNPYHYGTPVEGPQFAGRQAELDALATRMRAGISVVVISPRRYGKTSLLRKAAAVVGREGAAVVGVNVLRCRDGAAFAARLAGAAFAARGGRWRRARQAVPEFVRRLRVSPEVTFEDDGTPRFSFSAGLAPAEVDTVVADVYRLLAEEAPARPAALMLDEFQAVTDLGRHFPSLFKALADEHPSVSLVLAGSKRHLMERLVLAADAPLFRMLDHLALGPLPDDVMWRYLRRQARRGGKLMPPDAATHLLSLAGPVPNDVQRLAYEAFDAAAASIDVTAVDAGFGQAVAHESALYADRFEGLAPGQRRVLDLLARSPVAEVYSAAFARRAGLATAASVDRALASLEDAELVVRRTGAWAVADPFLAGWLRQGG